MSDEIPLPKENGRIKSTINLQAALIRKKEVTTEENKPGPITPDKAIVGEELKSVWEEFTELRKNQIAEYQLLKREFAVTGSLITIPLSNPIEEPLLHNIRTQLTNYLREKLNNNSITVTGILQETTSKKIIYTNKEKFDYLIEKNPSVLELKEKLGLDPDF